MPRTPRRRSSIAVACPACGSDKARVVQRVENFNEPDVQGEFRYEITQCDACGDSVLTFEQAEAHSRAYAAAVARARGAATPERIYELRMDMGRSQPQMEEAFGVGLKTWGRWERGTVAPSGPAVRLMWIAENERTAFMRMVDAHTYKAMRSVKIAGSIAPQGVGVSGVGYRAPKSTVKMRSRNNSMSPDNGGSV